MSFPTQLTQILDVLSTIESSDAKILIQGLPHAAVPQRHAFQQQLLELAHTFFEKARSDAAGEEAAAQAAIAEATAQLSVLQAGALTTKTALDQAKVDVVAKSEVQSTSAKAAKDADLERLTSERLHAGLKASLDQLRAEKAQAAAVHDGSLRMLVEGGWDDDEMCGACIDAVMGRLEELHSEETLRAAAGQALKVRPEARHPFDVATFDQVSQAISKDVAKTAEQFAAAEPDEEQAAAEALGLWALADVWDGRAKDASKALRSAEAAEKTAIAELRDAERQVAAGEAAIVACRAAQATAEARVKAFDEVQRALTELMTPSVSREPMEGVDMAMADAEIPRKVALTDGSAILLPAPSMLGA